MTAISLQAIHGQFPIGSIEAYMAHANRIPLLTQEEEHELAVRLHQHGDLEAAKGLILAHLRYVVKTAKGYLGYGLPLADLIQEGNVGLMKAVKRFNPKMGTRLVTFALYWIKAELHDFILKNWRIVKIATTKSQRKLFFNLRGMKKHLGWLTAEETQSVAEDLKVKPEAVREMEKRLYQYDAAFDGDEDDDESFKAPAGYLGDMSGNPALQLENADTGAQAHQGLQLALTGLDARSRAIVQARWLDEKKATLEDLAAKYSISAERVRQIEVGAMKKMRAALAA